MKQHKLRTATRRYLAAVLGTTVLAVSSSGCGSDSTGPTGSGASGGTSSTAPTFPLEVMITAVDQNDCLNWPLRGHRPQCAITSWENNTACYVTGLFPHPSTLVCLCYEGQTRSCTTDGSLPGWCDMYGTGCGVQYCVVTGTGALAHSDWDPNCQPL